MRSDPAQALSQIPSEEYHLSLEYGVQELELQLKLRDAEIASLRATVTDLRQQTAELEDVELQLRLKTLKVEHRSEREQMFGAQQTQPRDRRVDPRKGVSQPALVTIQPKPVHETVTPTSLAGLPQPSPTEGSDSLSTGPGPRSSLKRASGSESDLNLSTLSPSPFKRPRTSSEAKQSRDASETSGKIVDSGMVGGSGDGQGSKKATTPVDAARLGTKPAQPREEMSHAQKTKGLKERLLAQRAARMKK